MTQRKVAVHVHQSPSKKYAVITSLYMNGKRITPSIRVREFIQSEFEKYGQLPFDIKE